MDIVSVYTFLSYSILSLLTLRIFEPSRFCGEVRMNRSSNSYCNDTQDVITPLRDIIDVLYDGYCKVLIDEELCTTIRKKMKELQSCSNREKRYKLLKIFNILNATQNSNKGNCNLNREVVLSILDEIYYLCIEILKQLE